MKMKKCRICYRITISNLNPKKNLYVCYGCMSTMPRIPWRFKHIKPGDSISLKIKGNIITTTTPGFVFVEIFSRYGSNVVVVKNPTTNSEFGYSENAILEVYKL